MASKPTLEEISIRARQVYESGWEESFSVEHLIAAENELMREYAQGEATGLGVRK